MAGLKGLRVLVTRPEGEEGPLVERLRQLGAVPLVLPTIAVLPPEDWGPVDRAVYRLEGYHWVVFTSANGVRMFLGRVQALRGGLEPLRSPALAAVGPATARALEDYGLKARFVPSSYLTEAVAREMPQVEGRRLLLPRADIASPHLARMLEGRGAEVEQVAAYSTRPAHHPPERVRGLLAGGVDIVTFTSASAVRSLVGLAERAGVDLARLGARVACIGPVTASAAQEAGLAPSIVASRHTLEGLVEAILQEVGDA